MRAVLAFCLSTLPLQAETPLDAQAFDSLTLGRTLTWSEFGQVYGVEQYLPDRRVRWTILGDECKAGVWYPEGDAICFKYDDDPTPACWVITASDATLVARYVDHPPNAEPVILQETTEPLTCFGPEVGV